MEITLKDIWAFILATVGLIASVVTVVSFTKPKRKNITFKLLSNAPILSVSDTYRQKLSVVFKGIDVKHIYRFTFVIRNAGNLAITKDEFETPLRIVFSNGIKILDINSVARFPKDIDINYKTEDSSIIIKPFMLNPEEYIVFDTVLDNENHDFSVLGRIKDITEFNILKPTTTKKSSWKENFPVTLMTFGMAYIFASFPYVCMQKNLFPTILPLIIGLICLTVGCLALLSTKSISDEDKFYLVHANNWIDVKINKAEF